MGLPMRRVPGGAGVTRTGSSLEEGLEVHVEGWETTSEGREASYSSGQEGVRAAQAGSSVCAEEVCLTGPLFAYVCTCTHNVCVENVVFSAWDWFVEGLESAWPR